MTKSTGSCPRCGTPVAAGSRFCAQCGNSVIPVEPAATAETRAVSAPPNIHQATNGPTTTGVISWEFNVPLLTDQFIMYDLLKVWGLSSLFLFLLLTGIVVYDRNWRAFTGMLPVVGLVSGGFLALLILVMLVFFGNRFPMGFMLGPQGAMVSSLSRRGRWGNRLAVVLGVLAGKPGVAGAGLLGMARETTGWPGRTCGD